MKICLKCGISKLESAFDKRGSGLRSPCKECRKVYDRNYYATNKEECREYSRKYSVEHKVQRAEYKAEHQEEILEYRRKYQAAHKEEAAENQRWWIKTNPEKKKAYRLLRRAVRNGTIVRPSICAVCGIDTRPIDAHHPDHDQPLEVVFCCRPCHARLDRILRQEAA